MRLPVAGIVALAVAFAVVVRADVPVPRFTRTEPVAGQPIVADAGDGLVWQGCVAGRTGSACSGLVSPYTWEAALDYCQDLTWAGFTDWYLPNVTELASIDDDTRVDPCADPTAFPGTPSVDLWSSTSNAGLSCAWTIDFRFGDTRCRGKTGTYFVRCVRRGP